MCIHIKRNVNMLYHEEESTLHTNRIHLAIILHKKELINIHIIKQQYFSTSERKMCVLPSLLTTDRQVELHLQHRKAHFTSVAIIRLYYSQIFLKHNPK